MAPAAPDLEVTVSGTLQITNVEEGLWQILGDDGTVYTSLTEIPAELLVDGGRVTFRGLILTGVSHVDGVVAVEIVEIGVQP